MRESIIVYITHLEEPILSYLQRISLFLFVLCYSAFSERTTIQTLKNNFVLKRTYDDDKEQRCTIALLKLPRNDGITQNDMLSW